MLCYAEAVTTDDAEPDDTSTMLRSFVKLAGHSTTRHVKRQAAIEDSGLSVARGQTATSRLQEQGFVECVSIAPEYRVTAKGLEALDDPGRPVGTGGITIGNLHIGSGAVSIGEQNQTTTTAGPGPERDSATRVIALKVVATLIAAAILAVLTLLLSPEDAATQGKIFTSNNETVSSSAGIKAKGSVRALGSQSLWLLDREGDEFTIGAQALCGFDCVGRHPSAVVPFRASVGGAG